VHAKDTSEDFSQWSEEYKQEYIDSYSADTFSCPIPAGPMNLSHLAAFRPMRSCRPSADKNQLLYVDELTEQEKRQRDDLICECFNHGNTYESTTESALPPAEREARGKEWRKRAAKMSETEYASRVFGEGFGPAITSMNFADDKKQAETLAGVYLQYDRPIEPRDTESLNHILDSGNLTDEKCVPPREFIFNEQFPLDASFYDDLARPFNPDDWDYAKLAKKFDGITKLEDVSKVQGGADIINRMKFLLHNPQFKAMFMAPEPSSSGNKARLYKMLQENLPRPGCADILCFRDEKWKEQLHHYQDKAREFLSDEKVVANIQSGIKEGQRLGWSKKKTNTSELLDDPLRASAREWKTYCEFRNTQRSPVNPILAEIDNKYGIDFENIASNEEFQALNDVYCTTPRLDKNNKNPMAFGDYRKQNCSQVDRRTCLALFVQSHPNSSSQIKGLWYNINEILEKPDTIAQVTSDSMTTITTIGSDAKVRTQSLHFLEEQPEHVASRSVPSEATASAKVTTPVAPVNASSPLNPQAVNQQQMFLQEPVFQPQVQVPTPTSAAPQKVETIRENLSQSESQTQLLRNEISALRSQLTERTERKASRGAEPSSVEQRLASLEKRLSDKERENTDLRQQLSSAQKPQTVSTAETAPSREAIDRQNFPGSTASVSSAVGPQAVTAPAPISAPLASAGGGFNSSSLSSANRALGPSGSDLLQKYGLQDSSGQGGIVVSSSGGGVNYQMLRSQSEKSVLPLTISSEEFNQLASNDDTALSKYLPQVKALPGEVVRLAIKTSDDRSMEVFVVKNGSEFSIFRTPEEAGALTADRKPASVLERANTLQDLKNEFTN
jgi:hypothetical protein